jgi:hypothetical protein
MSAGELMASPPMMGTSIPLRRASVTKIAADGTSPASRPCPAAPAQVSSAESHVRDSDTVTGHRTLARFLLHVLPNGFVKIRHYGLHASSNVRTKLVEARRHLEANDQAARVSSPQPEWNERFLALTGVGLETCPRCGGQMTSLALDYHPSGVVSLSPTVLDSS